MSPGLIAKLSKERGSSIVALSDHNSALNTSAFAECCKREGLYGLFGMEACSREEVHVLIIFETVEEALSFGKELLQFLPPIKISKSLGYQIVVNEDEEVLDEVEVYLGSALDIEFGDLCNMGIKHNALVIPAHIDRAAFSVTSQLGFLPEGPYSAVECTRLPPTVETLSYPSITGSDAHYKEHIARRSFSLELSDKAFRNDGTVDIGILRAALITNGFYKTHQK